MIKTVVMAAQTGPPRATGERDWSGSRKGNGYQERISPKFGQELLLPELVSPPLTGAPVILTPVEFHSDFQHISTFFGGYPI